MQNSALDGKVKKSAKDTIEVPPMSPGLPLRSRATVMAWGAVGPELSAGLAFLLPTYTVSPALGPSELYSAHRAAGTGQGFTAPRTALTKEGPSRPVSSTPQGNPTMCSPRPSVGPHSPPVSGSFITLHWFISLLFPSCLTSPSPPSSFQGPSSK